MVIQRLGQTVLAMWMLFAAPFAMAPAYAEIDFSAAGFTQDGVRVLQQAPPSIPPTRSDTGFILKPKLRPAEITPDQETQSNEALAPAEQTDGPAAAVAPQTPQAENTQTLAVKPVEDFATITAPEPQETQVAPDIPNGPRPKARPTDLVFVDPAFPGHAGKRPVKRPRELALAKPPAPIEPRVQNQPAETEPATPPAQSAQDLLIERKLQEAEERRANIRASSRFAVASSRIPAAKPTNFAAILKRTQANINKASLTVEEDREPTSGSTSKFNKGRISLVGVYGTSSSRRALIRTSAGRYVKVKRGQNVSGWRVAAIGESSVRITKGARSRTLRLP